MNYKRLLAIAALLFPLMVHSESILAIGIYGLLAATLAVSFNLIFGFTGQLSLFHAAAFGISAYTTAILVTRFQWGFWTAILPAIALVAVLAAIVGTICFRFKLREFYFAVVTMAFAELARLIIMNWNDVTNGTLGMTLVAKPSLGGMAIDSSVAWYYLALGLLAVTYLVCAKVVSSWIGRCLEAIRLNDALGESLGINVFAYKLLVFVLGSVLAGLAGSLYGFYTGFIEPNYLSITHSLDIVAMVLLGGIGSLFGPIIGAFVLIALPHVIDLGAEIRIMLYGGILIFVILAMPGGITGIRSRSKHAA